MLFKESYIEKNGFALLMLCLAIFLLSNYFHYSGLSDDEIYSLISNPSLPQYGLFYEQMYSVFGKKGITGFYFISGSVCLLFSMYSIGKIIADYLKQNRDNNNRKK